MFTKHSLFTFLFAALVFLAPGLRAASATQVANTAPVCLAPVANTYEVATWSSTSHEVVDYTNQLIRLNPNAQMLIIGKTVTLTSQTGTALVRPAGDVPSGVTFKTHDG